MKIFLQPRDREILKCAFTFRAVSYQQIGKRFFANAFRTVAPRRIHQLCHAGLLKSYVNGENSVSYKYVSLTTKGWQEIGEEWGFTIDNPLLKTESPIHDLHLAEVAFCFEKLSSFKFFASENLLQSSSAFSVDEKFKALAKLQADGAVVLTPPGESDYIYGLEIEISRKSPERYREKLLNYYMAEGIDGVLYVSNSQLILDSLAKADREIRGTKKSILHFAQESDVLLSNGRIHFQKPDGDAIELF